MSSRALRGVIATIVLAGAGSFARASQVVPMDLPVMADLAGQVITGRVASHHVRWTGSPATLVTDVAFVDVTVLKGPAVASGSFTLTVPGGIDGQRRLRVCCAPEFAIDSSWVLFLLPEYRTHPVVGLFRGAFQIERAADGSHRVRTADGIAVTGVRSDGEFELAGGRVGSHHWPAHHDDHVRVRPREDAPRSVTAGLTLAAFCTAIKPFLDASRDQRLDAPAGRPVQAGHAGTALQVVGDHGVPQVDGMRHHAASVRRVIPRAQRGSDR